LCTQTAPFKPATHLQPPSQEKNKGPEKELRRQEYANRKEPGAHDTGKPIVPNEEVGKAHSGRPLPEETILKDSNIIASAGRLAKRNE
jgi:hypothetical protein